MSTQNSRRVNRRALYNALMRACFKAEILNGKCFRLGITGTGLERAARDFRRAADLVEQQKGKSQ